MNNFAQEVYNNLMKLVEKSESFSFFYKDFVLDDKTYRIFNYHLAAWTMFQEPGALNCRGTMFDVTNPENVKLVSLPPEKFFNYEEGGIDHTVGKFGDKMEKMDGSLISTYVHNDELYLKSKGSLFSSQANNAMKLLNKPEYAALKDALMRLAKEDYTINLEYTSPTNRIVVNYQKEELTVLSVRSHVTGENYFASKLQKLVKEKGNYEAILNHLVKHEDLREVQLQHPKFVEDVRNEQIGEGYVVEIVLDDQTSYLVKIKNLKYIALHHTKDSVNSPKRLFEVVINEGTDDLRAMFADDPYVLQEIDKMERLVQPIFNRLIKTVENFYEQNKHLDRKSYAVKAQKDKPTLMSLMMNMYVNEKIASGEITPRPAGKGKPYVRVDNDYKAFAIKYRKELFGIGDEEPELDDDGVAIKKHDTPLTNV